ncbi:MAG: hypothetical protein IT372_40545 [Polyangiaceae bacterium]|nr:hypothetical protein [Polyangiaceae bacterium]
MSDLRMQTCALFIPAFLAAASLSGCVDPGDTAPEQGQAEDQESSLSTGPQSAVSSVSVHLVPRPGISGLQRVNFAVPLPKGALTSITNVRVRRAGVDIAAGKRALALYPDGSIRSVQIQVDLQISGESDLEVRIGEAQVAGTLSIVPVLSTLMSSNGAQVPKVWAFLPATWLSASGVAGPQVTEASVAGTPLSAWSDLCDYDTYEVDAFLEEQSNGAVWLFDRGTTMYRGYVRTGERTPLFSAYRETSIYRSGISASGDTPVPGKYGNLMYHYAQNMAIHYLLSGDDRFRESAELISTRIGQLWNPWWNGERHWTERNAGFMLLAYVWTAIVSDNRSAEFWGKADDVVNASLDVQNSYSGGSSTARCFAHTADSHGEPYGYWGCSPWMSAILADGLDQYATERGGARATAARSSIVKLGRILAQQGRDGDGRPYYWMGVGTNQDEADESEEHWGESAYIIAMAWFHGGKTEPALKTAADQLVQGLRNYGEAPHMRSFNWQCRSAVATPYYMK